MSLQSLKRSALAAAAALMLAGGANAGTVTVDVSNIFSNDPLGSAINETLLVSIGKYWRIIGIGWNVELFADSPSWLSEIAVDLSDGAAAGFSLTPGFGSNNPGDGAFSSGIVDLVASGDDFRLTNTGQLRLEFFETFDDFANDWDGFWRRGTLTIQVVPEPASYGMAALALLAAGAASRRRRTAEPQQG